MKPHLDWLRHCGIPDVGTFSEASSLFKQYMVATRSHSRYLLPSVRQNICPTKRYIGQLDVVDDALSVSKVTEVLVGALADGNIHYKSSNIYITDHAVRRYWEHTLQKPDIRDWLQPVVIPDTITPSPDDDYIATHQALLCGKFTMSTDGHLVYDPKHKRLEALSMLVFDARTAIPYDMLNNTQRTKYQAALQKYPLENYK